MAYVNLAKVECLADCALYTRAQADDMMEEGQYVLCRAKDCALIDDTIFQQLFNPLAYVVFD